MGMRKRRAVAAPAEDLVTHKRAAPEYPDNELGHFRHHPTYSIGSAVRYVFVLSLLLWWLPTIGQMIAGYVGGRRAGGPWRGVVAAILPVAVIVALAWGWDRGYLAPYLGGLAAVPSTLGQAVSAAVPPATPYVDFVLAYFAAFVGALKATLSMGTNGYLVTVVFAYIGGILADQARREAAIGRGTSVGVSITQPFFAPFRRPYPEWEGDHPEHYDHLRRIPVRSAEPAAPASRPKPHKVDAPRAVSGAEEGLRPAGDGKPKPEPKQPERRELTPHDQEAATRRFVERALRQYEAAHRR